MKSPSRIAHNRFRVAFIPFVLASTMLAVIPNDSHSRKELLTTEEKELRHRAEHIHIEALALTGHGPLDAGGVTKAVAAQLERLGYHIVADSGQPHDVTVKVKCEELKTWEGTQRSGGDADMLDAAARLWKGPACQLSYRFGTSWADWRHEVRTSFSNPQEAARQAGQADTSAYAITALIRQLETDPFPYLLAAEWGQSARLITALDESGVTTAHKPTIIRLLGQMIAADAVPKLTTALKDPEPAVARAAAMALGTIGQADSIPPLLALFKSGTPEQHRAAAVGLGRLAPLHPSSEIVPALIAALPSEPAQTQIIIVRALGKTADRRVLGPLRTLHRSVLKQVRSDSSPELKELLTSLGIALDGFDGVHTEE